MIAFVGAAGLGATSSTVSHQGSKTCTTLSALNSVSLSSSFVSKSRFNGPSSRSHLLLSRAKSSVLKASAASDSQESSSPLPIPAAAASTLKVGLYIALWYAFNIVYNISNKKALNALPLAWFVSWIQLVFGLAWIFPLWIFKVRKVPKLSMENIKAILPIAIAHTVGHVATVASLGSVAVSFTHVIKSMEPFFNVIGSAIVLRSVFPTPVYVSLLPIVAGVIVASVSELSFTWLGFASAMLSNLAFTGRNIFSKLNMDKPKGENMDAVNLFAVIQIISSVILAPFALAVDGLQLKAAWTAATTGAHALTNSQLLSTLFVSGLFFQLYQEVAFLALNSVHPVTHAVANTMKRVVIIITSIFVFQNPVTLANMSGSAIAIAGVLIYSLVKNHFDAKAKAESAK
uniref:Sugar phosphate transporter domain-containing protein n=1 Tax=Timspurckia oligopyrenoides TaxID=708627 RepID=A0A7S0ZCN0_9RHOD|mmetsp:Transcript_12549/g.22631  ORF Transcript_12549/g.22631 Transcript_12549/m.22631 type:complete len:402 (+) Transcript_12549:169-1374(+)|eukprot:CAMPEP_0182448334 /NCGR_PEP_ID=MMETSP1172-20130603/26071_1 /TAXON_ID=708627 /ORGANISM="Timspurckia oligopyrenoides, Strain CCMP3278" /LENGTH=401 /DNA_ID=CAMNT_0024645155 /DNA_START=93 /DNA_END=1298 /DNA_ORIENTATION=-